MREKLAKLIEVRKIIALTTLVLFTYLSVVGVLEPNFIETVITAVIGFYFGKSTALDKPKE